MEQPDLGEIGRRPQRYWNVDGLPELVMGLLWVVWGGAWLFGEGLPRGAGWNTYWVLVPAALAGSGVLAVWLIKWLKARVTFPRTGYVEWKEPSARSRLGAAGIALATAAFLVAVARGEGISGVEPAHVLGALLAFAFVVVSLRQRAPHHLALAAVALASGIALGTSAGGWTSASWLFVAVGAASAGVGAVRLAAFLRRHPRPRLGEA